ncbi:MAG: RDD family protein [Bacteriovoracaceae bacterium]|jgi:hypothetical protein|nr:RDD family protein [Bacteriovoracaceae bacterium]
MENFDIDDILNQDELFKPITKGLGFHHSLKEKSKVVTSLKEKSEDLRADLALKARSIELEKMKKTPKLDIEQKFDMGELNPFYESNDEVKSEVKIEEFKEETLEADITRKFLCSIVDTSLFSIMLAACIFVSSLIMDISFEQLKFLTTDPFNNILLFTLVGMIYSLSFSFLERANIDTVGKNLFNLSVVSTNDKLSFKNLIVRNALGYLSVFTLGLISLLKINSKLSMTKLVHK